MSRRVWLTGTASAAALCLAACAQTISDAAPPRGALYSGFTLVDPVERTVAEDAWLVVENGRIADFGHGRMPDGAFLERRDLSGHYALPGFIDVHGHITAGPHAVEIVDGQPVITMDSDDAITEFNARMALAFGVTTVRNPGADPEASAAYDRRIASGEWIGPAALHAGAVIEPPPMGGDAVAYPRTEAEWDQEAARQAALGMRYFKLYTGLSEDELAAGVAAARAHGLEPIAHLDAVSWTRAVELGVAGLLHALPTSQELLEPGAREEFIELRGADSRFMYQWFERVDFDGPRMQRLFDVLVETGTTVDLTLQVNKLMTGPDALDRIYPAEHRAYIHPRTLAGLLQFASAAMTGWTDEDTRRAQAAMDNVYEFAHRLDDAGVPIGVGTDGPGGGPFFATELEIMVEGGFEPWRVLELATAGGARVMGLENETGRWADGYQADVVFLRANPLHEISASREVAWVMTDGVLHSFDDLAGNLGAVSDRSNVQ
ncbi:amidohydrolase [Marinicauda salina]|uniref:Amidohydrolase n=1 Tax=Marinicauda salina TaxID=2135793 RepID=A0A2U2BY09_9PROT|nr:amidohydrolase family protein [Marinicauda salina]PWE18854.1 amidohydrolase [Marinicauda salina]